MTGQGDLSDVGRRIEELLDLLGSMPDRRARQCAEELLRLVLDLYGAGLERVLELGCAEGAPGGPALLERLLDDELVSSLLLVSDLHPLGLRARVERVLAGVSAAIPDGDARLLELDEEHHMVRVRLLAPDGTVPEAMAARLRKLVEQAAPEIVAVEIDRPGTPVRLRRKEAVP
ncbi:MAG TPA: hypothetical protein VEI83_04695 [Acidimicrobiales bacterium]|nr:hypothetical protein [Acidimicrobiales bacterium]